LPVTAIVGATFVTLIVWLAIGLLTPVSSSVMLSVTT